MATTEATNQSENCKEGSNLLGPPKFKKLENGRFKCTQTGHELPQHAIDEYSKSKRCRLGLIDFALSKNKPPLNMFTQDPLCRSKLTCKLTGDTVNKSEEHIWKHINGKRFLNKLEQMEADNMQEDVKVEKAEEEQSKENGLEKKNKKKKDRKKKKKKKAKGAKLKKAEEADSEERGPCNGGDLEELEFWVPPVGDRWDFDDGKDRWGSDSESEGEEDVSEDIGEDVADDGEVSEEPTDIVTGTKRMSVEVGPSSNVMRKKKKSKTKS